MQYTVEMMSRVLAVSASGFYKWLKANPLKVDAVASIKEEIATVYKESGSGIYPTSLLNAAAFFI